MAQISSAATAVFYFGGPQVNSDSSLHLYPVPFHIDVLFGPVDGGFVGAAAGDYGLSAGGVFIGAGEEDSFQADGAAVGKKPLQHLSRVTVSTL